MFKSLLVTWSSDYRNDRTMRLVLINNFILVVPQAIFSPKGNLIIAHTFCKLHYFNIVSLYCFSGLVKFVDQLVSEGLIVVQGGGGGSTSQSHPQHTSSSTQEDDMQKGLHPVKPFLIFLIIFPIIGQIKF